MSIYLPAESHARIQVAVAETTRRQRERQAIRKQLAAARRIGLAYRHRTKLNRAERNQPMVLTTKTTDAPVKRRRVTAADPASTTAEAGAVEHEQEPVPPEDYERNFRLADQYLQVTVRHLRKLRHLAPARDALKLTTAQEVKGGGSSCGPKCSGASQTKGEPSGYETARLQTLIHQPTERESGLCHRLRTPARMS